MSNAKKSQPEDELIDAVELPNEDDFSLAALDFLSADFDQPTNGAAVTDDFFDTGSLASLASLGWRDTDSAESADADETIQTHPNGTTLNGASDVDEGDADSADLFDLAEESMTGSTQADDDEPVMLPESFTQSVPDEDDDADGLLELAESFTQSTPDNVIDDSLLDLAESFTGAVLDTGGVSEIDDEAPTVVLAPSDYIAQLQAELATELGDTTADDAEIIAELVAEQIAAEAERAKATSVDSNDQLESSVEPISNDAIKAAPVESNNEPEIIAEPVSGDAIIETESDLLAIAEAATEIETTEEDIIGDDDLFATDERDEADDLLAIAEAAIEPVATIEAGQVLRPSIFDDDLQAMAQESADALDDEAFLEDLLDLSADDALDELFDENSPTTAEFDALLDNDSRYLDGIVAQLDAESDHFAIEEAEEIELLTPRQDVQSGEQYVVFTLGDTEYGIPVANVLEVGEPQEPTMVPFVPHWVRGIINLRGEIVSLVDLRGFLQGVSGSNEGWMIISQTRDETVTVGLLVDDVRGNRQLGSHQQADVGSVLDDESARFLQTVFEEDGQMIAALDFDRLLNSAEMRQFEM